MLETLRLTRAAGIRVKGLLMMAHPTEDEASLAETVDFLRTAPCDLVQITKFTPYPGTPSYPTIREHGTFTEDWEQMNAMNWVFVPNGLARDCDLRRISGIGEDPVVPYRRYPQRLRFERSKARLVRR